MYKTVRHGENSLQYTILPQTEEVLNNSGLKGKGRDYSPSIHVRRSRRRSTLKYVLLIVFGIVVALALASVPLYIMNAALYARRSLYEHQDIITTAPLTPAGREIAKSRKKELKILPEFLSTENSKQDLTTQPTVTTTNVPITVIRNKATTPPWTMPALRSWKGLTPATTLQPVPTETIEEIPLVGTPSGSVRLLDNYMSVKPWEKDIIIRPTATPEPMTIRNFFKLSRTFATSERSVTSNAKLFDDVLITTRATTIRSPTTTESTTMMVLEDEGDELKESLEVDEVFSLPPLKSELGIPVSDSDEVTVSKAGGNEWERWPLVDPSSYFRWTGYSVGDNLLLPLLIAVISSSVLLILALSMRRRRKTSSTSAQIGKITADLQEDDNTNLLQAENPEEGEE